MIKPLRVFAPAKINLCLHITGRREDGYHLLDSLVAFADIGDQIYFKPAPDLSLDIQGHFARAFTQQDRIATRDSKNLVIRAIYALADCTHRDPALAVTLHKNIPLGAGLGGGSADAAACLWGLMQWWDMHLPQEHLDRLTASLGSDVSACLRSQPTRMQGTGHVLSPLASMPEMPVVLLWPNQICETGLIYKEFANKITLPDSHGFSHAIPDINAIEHSGHVIQYLQETKNDLRSSAIDLYPVIADAENVLENCAGCLFSRMSGSGSAVFGLFETQEQAQQAVETISREHKDWWARAGWINRVERY